MPATAPPPAISRRTCTVADRETDSCTTNRSSENGRDGPTSPPSGASPIPAQQNFRLPNLGICSSGDIDYFTVTVGGSAHINARIEFSHAGADLNLALLDAAAAQLRFSDSSSAAMSPATETVDLTGAAAGKYYLRVAGRDAQTMGPYTLLVNIN